MHAAHRSTAPRLGEGWSRMLLRSTLPVAPSCTLIAQRASLAIRTVLLITWLSVDGAPPSIWYSEIPEAWLPSSTLLRITARVTPSPLILSLIHISEPTRLLSISYAVFC